MTSGEAFECYDCKLRISAEDTAPVSGYLYGCDGHKLSDTTTVSLLIAGQKYIYIQDGV